MTDDLPPIAPAAEQPTAPEHRERGRPPALNPDGSRKNPPRATRQRRDKAPKREPSPTRTPRASSLKSRIAAQLTMLSMIVAVFPPTSRDALSLQEIDLLADGIDKQAQVSPRFRKYVERALAGAGSAGLLGAIGIIAARRAARHDVLPALIDPALGAMIGEPLTAVPAMPPLDALRTSMEDRAAEIERQALNRAPRDEPEIPYGAPGLPIDQPSSAEPSESAA